MSKMQYLVFLHTKISLHLMHQAMNRETTEYVWSLYHLINCISFKKKPMAQLQSLPYMALQN